jgi:uncharacterized protein (TIGR00730 family)
VNICVFLSASDLDDRYTRAAQKLGRLIATRGHALVWGASDVGLMKVLADAVDDAGGRLIGVSVDFLAAKARPLQEPNELVVSPDLAERKATLLGRSDAVVIMVGGSGTLDEATEVLELRKHGKYAGPVVVLNTDGFYDGLQQQFARMDAEGFLPVPLTRLCTFVDQPEEALAVIEQDADTAP